MTKIVKPRLLKAAIVPFCITPNNTIAVVLGKIRNQAWTKSQFLYSDLGGRYDKKYDIDAPSCAAREFFEESLGALQLIEGVHTREELATALRNGEYFAKYKTYKVIKSKNSKKETNKQNIKDDIDDIQEDSKTHCTDATNDSQLQSQNASLKQNKKTKLLIVTYLIQVRYTEYLSLKYKKKKQDLSNLIKTCNLMSLKDRHQNQQHEHYKPNFQIQLAKKQSALNYNESLNLFSFKKGYNEMTSLHYFGINYILFVLHNKVHFKKKLTFLHNCRLRLCQVLPILKSFSTFTKASAMTTATLLSPTILYVKALANPNQLSCQSKSNFINPNDPPINSSDSICLSSSNDCNSDSDKGV